MKTLNRDTYRGKGRPRYSDYIMGSGERDYEREMVASSRRATWDEEEEAVDWAGIVMLALAAVFFIYIVASAVAFVNSSIV